MTHRQSAWDVPESLTSCEELFIPHRLRASFEFLKNARETNASSGRRGWPRYPGLPPELHTTAYATQALSLSPDPLTEVLVAAGASAAKSIFSSGSNSQLLDLLDLLTSVLAEKDGHDLEYIQSIIEILDGSAESALAGKSVYSTQLLAQAVLIEQRLRDILPTRTRRNWTDLLLARQRRESGGWPTLNGDPETVVATAWAVRALASEEGPDSEQAISGGGAFLRERLKQGWSLSSGIVGTYTLAVVLRATPQIDGLRRDFINQGVHLLREWMNDDGGWGGEKGEASSVENTALCVIALLELGDGRYIPVQSVVEAIEEVTAKTNELRVERDALQEKLGTKVNELCDDILKQRNSLIRERDELRKSVSEQKRLAATFRKRLSDQEREVVYVEESSRRVIDELQRRLERRESAATRLTTISSPSGAPFTPLEAALTFIAAAGASIGGYLFGTGNPLWGWIFAGLSAAFAVTALITQRRRLRVARLSQELQERMLEHDRYLADSYLSRSAADDDDDDDDEIDRLIDLFRSATEQLPASIREELIYRLTQEGVDLPRGMSYRFSSSLLLQLNIPPAYSQQLEAWLERAFRLTPSRRRVLFLQLRKAIL